MSSFAIQAEGIGKRYRIGTAAERHDTLGQVVTHAIRAPLRNLQRLRAVAQSPEVEGADCVWAIRDLSFEVKHGDVLGIVGRNGAGKSTLLKVLSRITEPTVGRALVRGRIGSLLEVGTGFHPELSGRENVFLNGSILGMDRAYIESRFDEIVEFAGVQRFIDTPVKRYSSGMYLRLAFAVAAHLEPDILIVDEVLAVGDIEFQKKCIGKMSQVAGEGRTVLFVSHNMGAVMRLCNKAILLSGGTKILEGPTRDVIQSYLSSGDAEAAVREWPGDDAPGDATSRLRAIRVCQPVGEPAARIDMQEPFEIQLEYEAYEPFHDLDLGYQITDDKGEVVLHTYHNLGDQAFTRIAPGRYVSRSRFPAGALNAGHYWITAISHVPYVRWVWHADRALRFEVELTCPRLSRYGPGTYHGAMGPTLVEWRREQLDDVHPDDVHSDDVHPDAAPARSAAAT